MVYDHREHLLQLTTTGIRPRDAERYQQANVVERIITSPLQFYALRYAFALFSLRSFFSIVVIK